MKTVLALSTAIGFFALTAVANAGCAFYDKAGWKGAKIGLQAKECALLGTMKSDFCKGFKVVTFKGWNDRIVSVQLHHNSKAYLAQHENNTGMKMEVAGKRGTGNLGKMAKHASAIRCYQ